VHYYSSDLFGLDPRMGNVDSCRSGIEETSSDAEIVHLLLITEVPQDADVLRHIFNKRKKRCQ